MVLAIGSYCTIIQVSNSQKAQSQPGTRNLKRYETQSSCHPFISRRRYDSFLHSPNVPFGKGLAKLSLPRMEVDAYVLQND